MLIRRFASLFLLLCAVQALHAQDTDQAAYEAFMQGRPGEAIPLLYQRARSSEAWNDYFDLGIAAHHNGEHGKAVVWLLEAYKRAPEQAAPRRALHALQVPLPRSWLDELGPLAIPGTGLIGMICMSIAGLGLATAICISNKRWLSLIIGGCFLVISLPGALAHSIDQQQELLALSSAAPLLGPTGQPLQTLAAGTVFVAEKHLSNDRILIRLQNDQRGYIDSSYCHAEP